MKTFYTLILSLIAFSTYPQSALTWEKSYGGSQGEVGYSVTPTSDGGYVIAGSNGSDDWDVTGHHSPTTTHDQWIVKLDANGDTVWTRSLGGDRHDTAHMVLETPDLGFIVVGETYSDNGDVWDHNGSPFMLDVWLVKLNAAGDTLWTRSYGGTDNDYAHAIDIDNDGGFFIGGTSKSTDGDVSGNNGDWDFWIVKTNSVGDISWARSFGGSAADYCEAIKATADGGCIAVGWTQSADSNVVGAHGGNDLWVIKIDSAGNLEWQNALGGSNGDKGQTVELSADGNYIVGGSSASSDGDVSGNNGMDDFWIIKLSTIGDTIWTQSYGGSGNDNLESLRSTCDNGYIVVGQSLSNDGDVSGHHGSTDSLDGWALKIDDMGTIKWEMSYGGTGDDALYGVIETDDGFIVATGYSSSTNGDVTTNKGENDMWTIKMHTNATNPQICMVTVDSITGENLIVWEDAVYPAVSYNIYKEGIVAYQFDFLANVPFDSLSIFIDTASKPAVVANRYRITSIDSCGFESDSSVVHRTLKLNTNLGISNDYVNLIWENYEGFTFGTYIIYKGYSASTMDSIDAVPSNIFMYTDSIQLDTLDLYYVLSIVHPSGGCTADKVKNFNSSKSNTASVSGKTPMGISVSSTDATEGNCNGTATVTVTGGITPYVYLWDDSLAQTNPTAINLCPGNYTVIAVDGVGDTITISVAIGTIPNPVGIANFNLEDKIDIYPNPNNGTFTIEIASTISGSYQLEIFNGFGQIVLKSEIGKLSNEIDLTSYPSGVYHLQIYSVNGITHKRIVIK